MVFLMTPKKKKTLGFHSEILSRRIAEVFCIDEEEFIRIITKFFGKEFIGKDFFPQTCVDILSFLCVCAFLLAYNKKVARMIKLCLKPYWNLGFRGDFTW